ncbi:6-aminohexanoate-dimer hydrolase OS=Afipia felis OX=1035 GN=nylB PE=4 SV=1 [Afipia felis]
MLDIRTTSHRQNIRTAHRTAGMSLTAAVLWAALPGIALTPAHARDVYPHAKEAIGTGQQLYNGLLTPDLTANTLRNVDRLFPTRTIVPSAHPKPFQPAAKQLKQVKFTVGDKTYDLFDFLAVNRVSGLLILKDGKVAYETYQLGNTPSTRWTSMSIAKSITSTLIGAALKDGYIKSLDEPVTKYVPRLKDSAYEGVSIRDVLMMSSGVKWNETYTDPNSDRRHLLVAQESQRRNAAMDVMAKLSRAVEPGTKFNYSTGETQVAGEILHGAIKRPLAQYLSEKIWKPYGMEAPAKWWLDSPGGLEIAGSGLSATLRDFARFGQFYLDGGMAGGKQVLPDGWMQEASTPKILKGGTPLNYGYMWWIALSNQARANKAFMARGIFGQFVYIDPTEHVVIAMTSAASKPQNLQLLTPQAFFDAVVKELK